MKRILNGVVPFGEERKVAPIAEVAEPFGSRRKIQNRLSMVSSIRQQQQQPGFENSLQNLIGLMRSGMADAATDQDIDALKEFEVYFRRQNLSVLIGHYNEHLSKLKELEQLRAKRNLERTRSRNRMRSERPYYNDSI